MAKQTHKKESRAQRMRALMSKAQAAHIEDTCDVAIVGAGASGLAAAIVAARRGASVQVFEKDLEAGAKILATGNGRCNFSNTNLDPELYNHPDFVASVFGEDPLQEILDLFSSCEMMWADENGRLYPKSFAAKSVQQVLLHAADNAKVHIYCGREVTQIEPQDEDYLLTVANTWNDEIVEVFAKSVIVASGGGKAQCLSHLNLNQIPLTPVLSPIACDMGELDVLDGKRARVKAHLLHNGYVIAEENGEVLFRTYGLSGIVIFNLSRFAKPGDTIALNLVPELDFHQLKDRVANASDLTSALYGMIDPVIANELLAKVKRGTSSDAELREALCEALSCLEFSVQSADIPGGGQVMRGGVDCKNVYTETLECKLYPGLYVCGEALDVDGACGGYNLSWAWISGMRAATDATQTL